MTPVLKTFKLIVHIKTLGAMEMRIHCMNVTEPAILAAQVLQVYTVVSLVAWSSINLK